ncbi:MAG: hypothetical protein HC831_19695 [Chloroflexia bacterium]|nr:hypothetical protein [Chloroflexia bacterium]
MHLEFEHCYKAAITAEDPYLYALLANTAFSRNDQSKAEYLLQLLYQTQKKNGSWEGKKFSMTYSQGQSLIIETTSLSVWHC